MVGLVCHHILVDLNLDGACGVLGSTNTYPIYTPVNVDVLCTVKISYCDAVQPGRAGISLCVGCAIVQPWKQRGPSRSMWLKLGCTSTDAEV